MTGYMLAPMGVLHRYCEHDFCRPVAVIDPENREQVERLWDVIALQSRANPIVGGTIEDMQAALREFAKPAPPKPDEPTGLGAVVEDREGRKWVRAADSIRPWFNDAIGWREWSDIDAVSEGVSDG